MPAPEAALKPRATKARAEPLPAAVQSELQRLSHILDYRNYALFLTQTPPVGYRNIYRRADRFDVPAFVRVRAFVTAPGHSGAGLSQPVRCLGRALAEDGTLCAAVVVPAIDVPLEVGKELVAMFNAPRGTPRVIMCGPEPDHHFVFYDEHDVPVGTLSVDYDCPEWSTSPGFDETIQTAQQRERLTAICEQLGLGLCHRSDHDPTQERAWKEWERQHVERFETHGIRHTRRRPTAPRVDTSLSLSALTADERRELCVWGWYHRPLMFKRYGAGETWGLEKPDGPAYCVRSRSWTECIAEFPRCDATVAEVQRCVDAANRGDPAFFLPDNAGCNALRSCNWSYATWQRGDASCEK